MLEKFVLATDDSCDLPHDFLQEQNIPVLHLSYIIDEAQYKADDMSPKQFYNTLRSGKTSATAQVNVEEARSFFEEIFKQGKDVFYIAFSSGLSGTCSSVQIAAQSLITDYPERRAVVVDSLAASMGQGLLVYKANELYHAGASIEELTKFVEDTRDFVAHSFTVDDLMHLHRGGRVSKASAIAGSMLGIKPILHVNNEGKLINIDKVRGRKAALQRVVDNVLKWCKNIENDMFMISHGDCLEDAEYVAELMKKSTGISNYMINYVGPVIGSHSGPGTIALFMIGGKI